MEPISPHYPIVINRLHLSPSSCSMKLAMVVPAKNLNVRFVESQVRTFSEWDDVVQFDTDVAASRVALTHRSAMYHHGPELLPLAVVKASATATACGVV